MRIDNDVKLDFSDVLIRPKRSTMTSRKNVQLERTFTFMHSGRTWTGVPIAAANMDTTGTFKMLKGDLRKEGYDLDLINDPVYVLKARSDTYEPLDTAFYATLRAGDAGY